MNRWRTVAATAALLMAGMVNAQILPEVPDGADEEDNRELRRWGTPRAMEFEPRDHVDIGEALGQMDFAAAADITGARFNVLRGDLARLQRTLVQFMLHEHTANHGYEEVYVPFIVNRDSLIGTGQLPKFEDDLFRLDERDWYLVPTAEVPVTNLVRDRIIEADELPLKFVCHRCGDHSAIAGVALPGGGAVHRRSGFRRRSHLRSGGLAAVTAALS